MKKSSYVLLLSLVVFLGCEKSEPQTLTEVTAHVISTSDSTTGITSYYLTLDSAKETVVPINLPATYQTRTGDGAVAVKFVNTGNTSLSGLPDHAMASVVYVVAIRKL